MLKRRRNAAARARGVTLIELMVTLVLLSLLIVMAAPNFRTWILNARVRTVSDALQNGLRLAQASAAQRSRQVVFFLTSDASCTLTTAAEANGRHWMQRTVPLVTGETSEVLQCGVLSDVAAGVTVRGPAAVCFNSMGRQTANPNTGVTGGNCALPMGVGGAGPGISSYDISVPGADRPLRVQVSLGGQVRQCDPALAADQPDACR